MRYDKTNEEITCLDVINLSKREAINLILSRDLVFHILESERNYYARRDPCYCSHRINLKILKGKVVGAEVH
jgi:hypothetical protein